MTYTLELIKDDGSFDKWGASNMKTIEKRTFGEHYSKLRLFQIAGEMMQTENLQYGEGWVNFYEDGELVDKFL